jgi:hypothetical protein
MKIYLASSYRRRFELRRYRADLQRIGCTVVARWLDSEADTAALKCARTDLEDIAASDVAGLLF